MAHYARCTIKTSFFVGEDESFNTIADEIAELMRRHPKVDKVTFHANVGFEFVRHYEEEDTYEQQDA